MGYRAAIFDFDYTLADATTGIVTSINHALAQLGYPPAEPEAIRRTVGMTLEDSLFQLNGVADAVIAAKFVEIFRHKADEVMTDGTTILPCVRETLTRLHAAGVKIGIVTSKRHYRIDAALEKFGMTDLVDLIVGFDDVSVPKPDPEGLNKAMKTLAVDARDTLYIGDSRVDAETARAAGVDFLAVTTGATDAAAFRALGCTRVARDLTAAADLCCS